MGEVPEPDRVGITALDGYPLAAYRYAPLGTPQARIVVAGATGVPQSFYRTFATHATRRGYEVVTFDYRGIGESAPANLRELQMDYRDWARLDLAAVLEGHQGGVHQGGVAQHLVGHSYGGHALGLLPDPSVVASLHAFGTGSGWHGWMPHAERLRVAFLWNVFGPVIVRTNGYLAWQRFGLGEDLPLDVYRQWKRWCRYRGYWFDDPEIGAEMSHLFARVALPITAVNAVDDRWSSPAARDAFFGHYSNADLITIDLHPDDIGQASVGHMGYFRRGSEPLWDRLLDELDAPSDPTQQAPGGAPATGDTPRRQARE